MKTIAIISDEISLDIEAAIKIGTEIYGLRHYELRMIGSNRVPDIAQSEADRLLEFKRTYNINYTVLSAGLFKCEPTVKAMEYQLEVRTEKAIKLAHKLGIPIITGFALFDEDHHHPDELRKLAVPYLREVCARMKKEGLIFAVETEYMTGCEVSADFLALQKEVGDSLKINWDPANSWIAGENPLDGYQRLQSHIISVHVKDADTREWRKRNPFVALSNGCLPWKDLIPLLAADTNIQVLTVETHTDPYIPNSEYSVKVLRSFMARAGPSESC